MIGLIMQLMQSLLCITPPQTYDSIDSDESFDELEEEGVYDIDEDEYCDYSHRDREGRNKFTEKEFSEWEYIDIDE